jgi:hypothetical protein
LYLDLSWSDLDGCSAHNNSAINGGGIHIHGGIVTGFGLTVTSNRASRTGAGSIVYACESYHLLGSIFSNNTANFSGGGMYIVGHTSNIDMDDCDFSNNKALRHGGGLYVQEGVVSMNHTRIFKNEVTSSTFDWVYFTHRYGYGPDYFPNNHGHGNDTNSNCRSVGGCIFSSNYPHADYGNEDTCVWKANGGGKLIVNAFATEYLYDNLYIVNTTGFEINVEQAAFSGEIGPDDYLLHTNDYLVWRSDDRITNIGFDICFELGASGGGLFIHEGTISMSNSFVHDNNATRYGGGIHIDGGVCDMHNVEVGGSVASMGGNDVYFTGGSMDSMNLQVVDFSRKSLGGSSIQTATCTSDCLPGQYGVCSSLPSASNCYVNCECSNCPAGKYSSSPGSTTYSDCISCGAGRVSTEGSSSCISCPVGKYATRNASDTGNGLTAQIFSEAKSCNPCTAGYFASSEATTVCQVNTIFCTFSIQ